MRGLAGWGARWAPGRTRLPRVVAAVVLAASALAAALITTPASAAPALSARAAVLIDASTGQTLYGRHPDAELAIASTTKLMTALLTLERTRPTQVFTNPDFSLASVDSQIGLAPGERMTVHDLLIALLLPSADDAAEDLAYNIGHGSVPRFIAMMNQRARSLRLTHTHYSTPIGLDTPGNYSSASDLVKLARYLLSRHPFFRHVVALPSAVLRSGAVVRRVVNLNDLVRRVRWVDGVKTGHTSDAGYVLVGAGTRNGMSLISAVLGTDSESARDSETLTLLGYGFQNFHPLTPVRTGQVLGSVAVRGWPRRPVPLLATATYTHVFPRAEQVRTVVQAPRRLAGPRPARAVVGQVLIQAGHRTVARVPLALATAVPRPPAGVSWRPFTLMGIVVLLAASIALIALRRQRTPTGPPTAKRAA